MTVRKKEEIIDDMLRRKRLNKISYNADTSTYTYLLVEVLVDMRDILLVHWQTTRTELQKLNSKLDIILLGAGTTYGTPSSENEPISTKNA